VHDERTHLKHHFLDIVSSGNGFLNFRVNKVKHSLK